MTSKEQNGILSGGGPVATDAFRAAWALVYCAGRAYVGAVMGGLGSAVRLDPALELISQRAIDQAGRLQHMSIVLPVDMIAPLPVTIPEALAIVVRFHNATDEQLANLVGKVNEAMGVKVVRADGPSPILIPGGAMPPSRRPG